MIVRNQESIRSLAESPDLVAHMHEVRPGRRLYLTYDLKRVLRHVSKVHGTLIAQRHGISSPRSAPASVIALCYAGDGPRPARTDSRLAGEAAHLIPSPPWPRWPSARLGLAGKKSHGGP